jgi:antitoxin Phd
LTFTPFSIEKGVTLIKLIKLIIIVNSTILNAKIIKFREIAMKTESATNAKIHFGRIIEDAMREPVLIEKSGRKVVIILSFGEYQRMAALEDKFWLEKAKSAQAEGFIGADASEKLIRDILDDKD